LPGYLLLHSGLNDEELVVTQNIPIESVQIINIEAVMCTELADNSI
jgi:hypothetical protein